MSRESHIRKSNWDFLTKKQKQWIETAPDNELLRIYAWAYCRQSDDLTDAIQDWLLATPHKNLSGREFQFTYPRKKPRLNHTSIDPGMLDVLLTLTST